MFSSISIIHFCTAAFPRYTQFTDVELIFNTQIKYLQFYSFFFDQFVFERTLLGVTALATLFLLFRPSDARSLSRKLQIKQMEENLIEMQ